MKKCDHPNVVRITEVIDDNEKKKIYILMEFCKKGPLLSKGYYKADFLEHNPEMHDKIFDSKGNIKDKDLLPKDIPVEKARKYMRQMTLALDYCIFFKII